jgi:putative transposase
MLCRTHPVARPAGPRRRRKDLELLVLRHQLAVLRRQVPRPKFEPTDRAPLAAVSRVLPRARWSCFLVKPDTLLRWHRRPVAGVWTYPHRGRGRPPLDEPLQQLIVRLATENPRWGYQRIKGELLRLACRSRQPQSAKRCVVMAWTARHDGQAPLGGRFFTSKPPVSWPATASPSTPCGCGGRMCCSCIELDTRRVHLAGVTTSPNGAWVAPAGPEPAAGARRAGTPCAVLAARSGRKFCRAPFPLPSASC